MSRVDELARALRGFGETALTLGSGAVAAPVGAVSGIVKNVTGPNFGTQQGVKAANDEAKRVMEAMTYVPRSQEGRDNLQAIGSMFEATKLPPIMPEAIPLANALRTVNRATVTNTVKDAADAFGPKLYDMAENYMTKTGGMQFVHQPNTPKKPNPMVGKTYEAEDLGGLVPKNQVELPDLKGSSIIITPWDSSSRNVKVSSISGEKINPFVTHGGHKWARDKEHVAQNIAGSSNFAIANRVVDRFDMATIENQMAGGNGKVIQLPVTMGAGGENFSVMPTDAILGLFDSTDPPKQFIKYVDETMRNKVVTNYDKNGNPVKTQPFKNFAGVMSPEGRAQLYDNGGGELRKLLVAVAQLKSKGFDGGSNQQMLKYNHEDLVAAITDPDLMGVPKGYIGNTLIGGGPDGIKTMPSKGRTYNTDTTGKYLGSLYNNVPVEVLMPKTFNAIAKSFEGKKGDMRTNVLGALEKRGSGISELIDQQVIDSYYQHLIDQKKKLERELNE